MDVNSKKYVQVGERLRELRGKISQEEFAKKISIPFRTYQRYEVGERIPHPHVLTRIAEIFDTTTDWILTGNLNIEKARMTERLKRMSYLEDIVENFEGAINREEKLLYLGVKEEGPEYGLERLEEKDFVEKLKGYIADVKIDFLPTETRKLIEAVIEILGSGNEVMIDALKGNIKAFLEAIRSSQKKDENKGGD